MNSKNQLNHKQFIFILAQVAVLGVSLAAIFWLMVLGNKEKIENDLKTKLDASTLAMAAQLKANQVPFSGTSVEPGVFIINQTDGTLVIDRRNGGSGEQRLWEAYKTKIIYEMQKQKRGWIEYPDKSAWGPNEAQRIIRYISIDELNWILAVEDLQPSSLELIKKSVTPSACFMILFIFIIGAGVLWFLTVYYFGLIKRQISASLEDNFLSLSGEEKLWGKSHGQIPKMNEIDKEGGLEFSTQKTAPPLVVEKDPIMEEVFHKPPAAKPAKDNIVVAPKEIPKAAPARAEENKDMAVDVQHINSPVLKKILQQFREK